MLQSVDETFLKKIGDRIGIGCEPLTRKGIRLFSDESLEALSRLANSEKKDSGLLNDDVNYAATIYKDVFNKNLMLKPASAISADIAHQIDTLIDERFPNFSELGAYLKGQFALARLADGTLRLPPILLVGEPGIGKTELLLQISELINTDFLCFDMAAAQSSFTLTGLSRGYTAATPGELFNKLTYGKTANPIVLLDEIDKAAGDHRYKATSGLYSLLERRTASKFADQSLPGVEIDASHVNWFAAANNELDINPPIRSRFKTFRIPCPDSTNARKVIASVYSSLLTQEPWGDAFPKTLPESVIDRLCGESPRAMKMVLANACANAALDGRRELSPADVELSRERRFGFCSGSDSRPPKDLRH